MLNLILASLISVCPTVSAKIPKANDVIKGSVTFEALARDDNSGMQVTIIIDGKPSLVSSVEKETPYTFPFDSHILSDGKHLVVFQAKDSGGCVVKTQAVSFSVKNIVPTPVPSPSPLPTPVPTPSPSPTSFPYPTSTPPQVFVLPASVATQGFTTLKPSSDSRIIYVSASGNDSNDGLSPEKPIQTPSEAFKRLRLIKDSSDKVVGGFPDWIVFKSGDVWNKKLGSPSSVQGRSATEPVVISRYGNGARPRFNIGSETAFSVLGTFKNVVIEGLHIRGKIMEDKSIKSSNGIKIQVGDGENFTFENNLIEKVNDGIIVSNGKGYKNVTFRRNIIIDIITRETGHEGRSSCLYAGEITNLSLIENVWDLCGYDPAQPKTRTVFSHAVYVQDTVKNLIAKGNIFSRGSEDGLKIRNGGLAEDNFFIENAIGISINDYNHSGVTTVIKDNIFTAGSLQPLYDYSSSPQVRNYGFWGSKVTGSAVIDSGNIFANSGTGAQGSKAFADYGNTSANKIYKWGKSSNSPGSFPDPNRTIERYHKEVLGGSGLKSDFYLEMRNQTRENYKPEYSATKINDYFQAGF